MAGNDGFTTLRHLLSQQKPPVACSMTVSRNSARKVWPKLSNVRIWDDFNLANLNESYGHVLDSVVPAAQLACPQPGQALGGLVINTAEDIKQLIGWNDGLMRPTLQLAKSRMGLHPGVILRHMYSTADKSFIAKLAHGTKRVAVDHIIGLDDFPLPNLVVGLGRPNSKWSGRKLASQTQDVVMELLWPVRQLANICGTAKTRYGYIQTDEELVVCCFSKNREEWKAAIMPVPWSRHGVEVLTTDLALWWLCMLAMSAPHHREIVEEGDVVAVGEWDVVYLDEERGWVRRHRYSNFEEPTEPPPPPDYQTPSPGNQAAFAAAVGLHADDSFEIEDLANADMAGLADFNVAGLADAGAAGIVDFNFPTLANANMAGFVNFNHVNFEPRP